MSKEAYYFSHDSNARNDEKILMLRAEHGMAGYGVYWILLEMMFESADSKLFLNKSKGIAVSCNIDITLLNDIINTAITEGLFVSDGDKFWSESLIRRKTKFHDMKNKKSEAGKKGMAKRWGNKQKDNTVITDDNTVITKDNKGKESKEKESKEKEIKELKHDDTQPLNIVDLLIKNNIVSPGGINYTLSQDLDDIEQNFGFIDPKEVMEQAIIYAARGNGRTWRFVFNKLNFWRKSGVKTVADAINLEEQPGKGGAASNGGHEQVDTEFSSQWGKALEQRKNTGAKF